jgi:hypothetical protein
MRTTLSFILFLLYDYYKKGKYSKRTAYEEAVFVFVAILGLNLIFLIGLFGMDDIIPMNSSDAKWLQYFKIAVFYFAPAYLIVTQVFKKEYIINLTFDESKMHKGNIALIWYCISSFVALIVVAVIRHGHN